MIPKITNPNTLRTIGMMTLAVGSTSHYLLHRVAPAAENLSDGLWGLLIGISIGCLLLSLRRPARPSSE
jgi:hypothetical protein